MPHSTAEQEPTTGLSMTNSESDVEGDAHSDVEEEAIKKPMKMPLTVPWGLSISNADVEKLKVGFESQNMDHRWDMLIEDPDENGNISLHILRSWLQEPCHILYIVPKPSNDNSGSAKIQSTTWGRNKAGMQCDAEQAKKEAVILSRGHLHCEFETLPHYPSSVLWDRNAYKKMDAE